MARGDRYRLRPRVRREWWLIPAHTVVERWTGTHWTEAYTSSSWPPRQADGSQPSPYTLAWDWAYCASGGRRPEFGRLLARWAGTMGPMSKPVIEANRGTSRHGPSIKAPKLYEKLRRKGYSKAKAAAISNAAANGTIDHNRRGKGRFALAGASRVRPLAARGNGRRHGRAVVTKAASVRGGHRRGHASKATGRTMRGGRR